MRVVVFSLTKLLDHKVKQLPTRSWIGTGEAEDIVLDPVGQDPDLLGQIDGPRLLTTSRIQLFG